MNRTLAVLAAATAALSLTACGSLELSDGGNYDGYRTTALDLAKEANITERTRILVLGELAKNGDDRTRDRVVSELAVRSTPQPLAGNLAAPAPPTHLGLEALRILGPGAIGLIGQGIGAWAQNQADVLSTQRAMSNNELIFGTISGALDANTNLGVTGMGHTAELAGQAVGKLPVTIHAPAPAAPAAAPAASTAPVATE